jgi:hypothetical protein
VIGSRLVADMVRWASDVELEEDIECVRGSLASQLAGSEQQRLMLVRTNSVNLLV